MNQVLISGKVINITYKKITDEYYETQMFVSVDNFEQTNPQNIPVKFINKLAHLSFVKIDINDYIYISGELIFYKDNLDNKYKTYVLGKYFENKTNPLKLWSKEEANTFFNAEWTPETLAKYIQQATIKLNKETKLNSIKKKAMDKLIKQKRFSQ